MGDGLRLGDLIQTRKKHPCGSDRWVITRLGADIKIRCEGCGRIVMLERGEFLKRRKKTIQQGPDPEIEVEEITDYDGAERE